MPKLTLCSAELQKGAEHGNAKSIGMPGGCACLQEEGVVEDELRGGDAEVEDAVVDGARRLQRPQRLLQVAVEAPQLQAAVQPPLHRPLLLPLHLLRGRSTQPVMRSHILQALL